MGNLEKKQCHRWNPWYLTGDGYQSETGKIYSRIQSFVIFLGVNPGVGAAGFLVASGSVDSRYLVFQKPLWTSPSRVFAPVRTILCIAMAIAAWRVWIDIKE